jgi:hypothetical protein
MKVKPNNIAFRKFHEVVGDPETGPQRVEGCGQLVHGFLRFQNTVRFHGYQTDPILYCCLYN